MNIDFASIVDVFKKCKEYTTILERLDALEQNVQSIKKQIAYADKTRICPRCHEPTLDFDYIEKTCLASMNTITGEKQYGQRKIFIAKCSACKWECDDSDFIKQRLHP